MMKIREAKKSDLEEIKRLNYDSLKFGLPFDRMTKDDKESKKWCRRFVDRDYKNKKFKFFVAVDKNKVIGFVFGKVEKLPPLFKFRKCGYIWDAYIDKKYRDKGLGKKLTAKLLKWFKSKKLKFVGLNVYTKNKKAVNFWTKLGFKEYDKRMRKML